MVYGAAYFAFPGSPSDAKQLGAFVEEIVGERHEQFWSTGASPVESLVLRLGPGLDVTYILIDKGTQEAFLLRLPDTDRAARLM